jgi:hypothetical protein
MEEISKMKTILLTAMLTATAYGQAQVCLPTNVSCIGAPNSTGLDALIGTPACIQGNMLQMYAERMPPYNWGYFITGSKSVFTRNPGGAAGNLCIGGSIGRFDRPGEVLWTGDMGIFDSPGMDINDWPAQPGSVLPGDTWCFQAWYRDWQANTSNFTSAIEVVFL